jgi:hypothetical protein
VLGSVIPAKPAPQIISPEDEIQCFSSHLPPDPQLPPGWRDAQILSSLRIETIAMFGANAIPLLIIDLSTGVRRLQKSLKFSSIDAEVQIQEL